MTELEKIEYTKSFIDKLATGINPVDNTPIPDTDIMNNVRLVRCMFYVSDILRQVIDNGGITVQKKNSSSKKMEFQLTPEELQKFPYSDVSLTITEIVKLLNSIQENDNMKRLSTKNITSWLVEIGALEEYQRYNERVAKRPTDFGNSIGIYSEERMGQYGVYLAVYYNKNAQKFLIDNFDVMLTYNAEKKKQESEQK